MLTCSLRVLEGLDNPELEPFRLKLCLRGGISGWALSGVSLVVAEGDMFASGEMVDMMVECVVRSEGERWMRSEIVE